MTAPDRIYLQDAGDYDAAAEFEVTWCVVPQDDADTEYVRADLARAPLAEAQVAALLDALEQIADRPDYRLPNPRDIARAALALIAKGAAE